MSLTAEVKEQICCLNLRACCKKAFLSAVIHTSASLNFGADGMSVVTDCDFGADFVKKIFDSLYPSDNQSKIIDGKFVFSLNSQQILLDLEIFCIKNQKTAINERIGSGLIRSDCCKKAYLAGAFLGCGILVAQKGYNLEFNTSSRELALDLCELLSHFEIKSLYGKKNGRFRAYIKDKDGVCDTLAAIGASKTVLKINSLIAQRDLKRGSIRKANCDLYNLDKSLASSLMQQEAIKNVELTDKKLIAVAKARVENPHASYDELKDILGVSKSTVKYRLQKIVAIYQQQNGRKL